MDDFLTTSDAARVLGVAGTTVHYYDRIGKLSSVRTAGGIRLFRREQIEQVLADRKNGTKKPRSTSPR
jgi:excisionase family DNA binding protein